MELANESQQAEAADSVRPLWNTPDLATVDHVPPKNLFRDNRRSKSLSEAV